MEESTKTALTAPCDACGEPITDGGGAKVSVRRAGRRVVELADHARMSHQLPYLSRPPLIRWRLLHEACDVIPATPDDHWIPATDLTDVGRLLFVLVELAKNRWLEHTDVSYLVAYLLFINDVPMTKTRRRAARQRIQEVRPKGQHS